jgi:hypothetical protein
VNEGDIILQNNSGDTSITLVSNESEPSIVLGNEGLRGPAGLGVPPGGKPGQTILMTSSGPVWQTLTPLDVGAPFVNVKDQPFGAFGDNSADDTVALQAAIDAAHIAGKAIVYLPPGTYKITSALTVYTGTTLMGAGRESTCIKQYSTTATGLYGRDIASVKLTDFFIEGPASGSGIGIDFGWTIPEVGNLPYLYFQNLLVKNFGSDGVRLQTPIVSTFINVTAQSNAVHGFNLTEGGTSCTFQSCWARENGAAGYRFYQSVYQALVGCAADNNGLGYYIQDSQTVNFFGCGAEGSVNNGGVYNGRNWLFDNSSVCVLEGCWITNNRNIGVHVSNGSNAIELDVADNSPNASAVSFIKTDTGTSATITSLHNTTANSLAADTVTTLNDGANGFTNKTVNTKSVYIDYLGGLSDPNVTFDVNATMCGTLTLAADPVSNLQAATKQYVDAHSAVGALLAANNLSDVANAATARTNLGVAIGTNVQAYDATLNALAGVTTAADKLIYATASDTFTTTNLTSTARSLLDDTSTSAMRTTLGLAIGTDVQAFDATLAALAAFNTNGLLVQTAADTFTGRTISGTTNQVNVSNGNGVSGNPTLSLPQDIHTGASPTFAGLTVDTSTLSVDATNHRIGLLTTAPTHSFTLGSTSTGIALYNTSDQVTNYERAVISFNSNIFEIRSQAGGTGTQRNIRLILSNTSLLLTENQSSSGFYQFNRGGSTAGAVGTMFGGTWSASSGTNAIVNINPTFTQTSTAGYTALQVNVTESTTGSGTKLLLDLQVGSSSKFKIDNNGAMTLVNTATTRAMVASATNTYDIGSASVSYRSAYIGTSIVLSDAANIAAGTTTGTQIGTATSQKLGFFAATPIVQPANTTDLRTALINLGLLASGGATPLNLNGGNLSTTGTGTVKSLALTDTSGTLSLTAAVDGGEFNISANASGTLAIFGSGSNTLNLDVLDGNLFVSNGKFVKAVSSPPATAGAAGTTGQIEWDSGFIYVCVATNSWKRAAIAAW